jgi:hypothetical protein
MRNLFRVSLLLPAPHCEIDRLCQWFAASPLPGWLLKERPQIL